MRNKFILGLTGLVVLALGAAGYWYAPLVKGFQPEPAPQALLAAEDALASQGLSMLGHFDVSYAVRAERAFYGPEDAGALPTPFTNENAFLRALQSSGFEVREAIDHALFGFGVFGEELGSAAILLGRFPADRLTAAMAENLEVEHGIAGAHPFLRITAQDPDTCGTETFVAHVAEDRIILARGPEILSTILDRLATAEPAERDLTDWRDNRAGKVASIAILVPLIDVLGAAARNPIESAMTEAVKEEILPIRGVYGGLGLQILPPAVGLEGWVEADGPAWPLETLAEAQSWRRDLVRNVGADVPTLLRLHDRLDMEADGARLRFALNLDESFVDDLGQAFSELVGLFFSSMGFGQGMGSPEVDEQEEEIIPLDQVPLVSSHRSHDQLGPFGEEFDNGMAWPAESGPFGVRIAGLRINTEDPEVVEIELQTTSSEIPTIALYRSYGERPDARAELVVTGVLGRDGRDLLRAEPCGEDRNEKAAELSPRSNEQFIDGAWVARHGLSGSKTVRLEPGARPEDIASLTGYVRLTLPTDIEAHRIAVPEAGQVFETDNLRMRFQGDDARAVAFDVSGDDGHLVELRALNQAGDYLASDGGGSGLRLDFGSRHVEKSFKGEPAEIELLIARQEAAQDYPFTIDVVPPPFPEQTYFDPQAEPTWSEALPDSTFARLMETAVVGEICEGEDPGTRVGPFLLCLDSLQKWGDDFNGAVTVHAPVGERLANQLSALEIVVDSITVQGQGGTSSRILTADPSQSRAFILGLRDYGGEYLKTWQSIVGVLAGSEEIGDESMIGMQGRLSLRMPRALSDPLPLDITSLGNSASLANGAEVTLTGYQFRSTANVVVDYQGSRADLLEIVQYSADGTLLGAPYPAFEPGDAPDTWTLMIEVTDRTATLDFVLAVDQHRRDYPFDLRLPE